MNQWRWAVIPLVVLGSHPAAMAEGIGVIGPNRTESFLLITAPLLLSGLFALVSLFSLRTILGLAVACVVAFLWFVAAISSLKSANGATMLLATPWVLCGLILASLLLCFRSKESAEKGLSKEELGTHPHGQEKGDV